MASKQAKPEDEGFEVIYRRLEAAVTKLEAGGLTLEQSLALYEEGMKLARRCQELLRSAELRITRLQESFANGLSVVRDETPAYLPNTESETEPTELPLE